MKRLFAVAVFLVAALVVSRTASATTISLGLGGGGVAGDHILGEVFQPGDLNGQYPGLLNRDAASVNGLLGVATGTRTGTQPEYYRSSSIYNNLPTAVVTGAGSAGTFNNAGFGANSLISILLTQAFNYLVVTYDGPHGGAEVYYIGDIAAGNTLEIYRFAKPSDDGTPNWGHLYNDGVHTQYGITSWTMFNPTVVVDTQDNNVPDGGVTATLLGVGLFGLGLVKRRLNS